MARLRSAPKKQRTRQHVIADQSVNYVERFIIDEGHTAQRLERDYGYDLLLPHVQSYFRNVASRQPRKSARTVRVDVSRRQAISRRAVATMRELKRRADTRISTESSS